MWNSFAINALYRDVQGHTAPAYPIYLIHSLLCRRHDYS